MANLPNYYDFITAVSDERNILIPALKGGNFLENRDGVIKYIGAFCIVFPYVINKRKYAIRCWRYMEPELKEKICQKAKHISQELPKLNLPYFLNYTYYENGIKTEKGCQPIIFMEWTDSCTLKDYIRTHLYESNTLKRLCISFKQMVKDLHEHEISHGDLQPNNILVDANGHISLIDYDTMYIPQLKGEKDCIAGLPEFQHEARYTNRLLSPKADYFSELIIYISILTLSKYPQLWFELKLAETKGLIFSVEDIHSKGNTPIFNTLQKDSELKELIKTLILFCNSSTIKELFPLEDVCNKKY